MQLPGEDTYWQSGISACAVCDGAVPIFRNKPLAVIGGGDSACEEATYLTKYASHVYVLVRRGELRASKVMAKRLKSHPKVTVLWNSQATEACGDGVRSVLCCYDTSKNWLTTAQDLLQSIKIKNLKTDEITELQVNGLFYAIGHDPATALVRGQCVLRPLFGMKCGAVDARTGLSATTMATSRQVRCAFRLCCRSAVDRTHAQYPAARERASRASLRLATYRTSSTDRCVALFSLRRPVCLSLSRTGYHLCRHRMYRCARVREAVGGRRGGRFDR